MEQTWKYLTIKQLIKKCWFHSFLLKTKNLSHMKKIIKLFIFILLSSSIFWSCEELEDIRGEYLEEGNIIYAVKPDTLQVFGGHNRVKVKYLLFNAANINKCIVEWQNGAEQKEFEIAPNAPLDSIDLIIDGLEERSYLFKVHTIDNKGNRSIKVQATGNSYGERYMLSIGNRPIKTIAGGNLVDTVAINWGQAPTGYAGIELTYNNADGEVVTKTIPTDEDVTVLRNWEPLGEMSYKTLFTPEEHAIDTFATEALTAQLPDKISFNAFKIDNSGWTITEQNSAAGGYEADKAIDGDMGSIWHTDWNAGAPGYPHHFVVDMGKQAIVSKAVIYRRPGGDASMASKVEIQTSADNATWVSHGTYSYDPAEASMEILLTARPVAQYVKYVAVEGPSNFTALAEIELYGQEQVSNEQWEVTDQNSFAGGYEADKAIDGDINTIWHTDWSGGAPGYPHYFVVDMKQTVAIGAFVCVIRQGFDNGATLVRLETSMDGTNWVENESFALNPTNNAPQGFVLSKSPEARYFKFVALEGAANFTHLAELGIIGEVK